MSISRFVRLNLKLHRGEGIELILRDASAKRVDRYVREQAGANLRVDANTNACTVIRNKKMAKAQGREHARLEFAGQGIPDGGLNIVKRSTT